MTQMPKDMVISIHTPMKGVTTVCLHSIVCHEISIHTPMKGVTSSGMMSSVLRAYFNPHSHEGSDSNFVQFRTFIF